MPHRQRRAHRTAGIAGGRLDPQVVKRPFSENAAVGHAVQGHPAGQTQPALTGLPMDMADHLQDNLFGHGLDAGGDVHFPGRDLGFGQPGRPAEQCGQFLIGHAQAADKIEIGQIEADGTVLPNIHQLRQDQLLVAGFAVGSQSHQLVFTGIDPESGKIGKCGVEQPQRIREMELLEQINLVAFANAIAGRGPFSHPVHGQDGSGLKGRGIEGRGRMGLVMFREQDLSGVTQFVADHLGDVDLFPKPQRHGLQPGTQPLWRTGEVAHQQAFEGDKGLVVIDDKIKLIGCNSSFLQTIRDGMPGKTRIVLLPGKPLFLGGGEDLPVPDKACRAVMVKA